jgi:hypothetical protein
MNKKHTGFEAPGTVVLTFLLLTWIGFLYFGNWITLSQAWGMR